MHANRLLFDTSALIEMLSGSPKGKEASSLFLSEDSRPLVASVSIAELASKLRRHSVAPEEHVRRISDSAEMLPLDSETALRAGSLHAQLKAKNKNISLADCVIMAHAEREGATVVTTDHHFLLYKHSRLL